MRSPNLFRGTLEVARENNELRLFVDAKENKEYQESRNFLLPEGKGGISVTKDGDIVSVFKNPHNTAEKERVLPDLMFKALESGGNRLDAYGETKSGYNLPKKYAKFGFEPVARLKWNDEFADKDWDYDTHGRPDIVFMRHTGESAKTVRDKYGTYPEPDMSKVEYVKDWDEGVARQLAPRKKEVTVDERRRGDSRIQEENLKRRGLGQGEVTEGQEGFRPSLSQADRQRFGKVLKDLSKREGREADGKLVDEPTKEQQDLQERMLEHFGVRVLFFERESEFGELGISDGTRAFVREIKDVDTHWTAGHEVGHVIARSNKTVEKGVKLKDVYTTTNLCSKIQLDNL